jgi:hypothetical protein
MNTHLSAEEIRNYLARRMMRGDYVKAGEHVHQCRTCYQNFLTELETRFPIEIDLDELAGLRDWHPGAEELAAYLEGLTDELDSDCIGLHLEECSLCRPTLQRPSYPREYSRSHHHRGKQQTPDWKQYHPGLQHMASKRLRIAGIAAVVIVVALTLWAVLHPTPETTKVAEVPPQEAVPSKEPSSEQPAPTPPPGSKDDPSTGRLAAPKIAGVPKLGEHQPERQPDEVETALIAELVMPSSIERLDRTPAVVTRGNRVPAESFSIVSPFATLIGTDRPTFRWSALEGVESYRVLVFDDALHLVSTSGRLTETEWMMRDQLKAGRVYAWTVTALKNGKEITSPPSPARAEFEVLAKSEIAKLNSRITGTASRALRGVAYAKAGLLDDADREFHAYLADHPSDYRIRKLLETIKSWRGIGP